MAADFSVLRLVAGVALACVALVPAQAQSPYTFGFSSITGSQISFDGASDSFQFIPEGPSSFDLQIDNSDGAFLDGLFGRIEGTFFINAPIDISGTGGRFESATVSGTGLFQIEDGAGGLFSSTVTWGEIYTRRSAQSTGGLDQTEGTVNLGSFSFTPGTASNLYSDRLAALAASIDGSVTVSFQFGTSETVTNLIAGGIHLTQSYSGIVSANAVGANIPEPASYAAVLALAGLAFSYGMRRRRLA